MSNRDDLLQKVRNEYKIYIDSVKEQDKDIIISKAYEITIKADIIAVMETEQFTEVDIKTILEYESPLQTIYTAWIDKDITLTGDLYETMLEMIDERLDSMKGEDDELE